MCPEHYIRLHLIRYKALPVSGFVILKLLLIMSGDTADNPGEEEQVEEAGPSLSQLWGYFEKADTQAKLILPDLLTNLYYLPLPKSSKVKKDAQFEREMRRFDFICQQESQNYLPINRSAIMAQIPNFGLTGRDRYVIFDPDGQLNFAITLIYLLLYISAIERKLVDPYRRDPQRRKELLQRVAEQQRLEFVHKPKPKVC